MAKLITGIQGSGKSYKAMHYIATSKDKYYRVYSNLDKLVNTRTIFSLDFNSFVTYALKECFKIMVTNNQDLEFDEALTDDDIFKLITTAKVSYDDALDYLKKIKMMPEVIDEDNRVLMILDEAQDYFGKASKLSPELLWFITQHRHLYIEVVLLTQDVSLIRSDYKLFNEVYDAVPPTKQFNKNYFAYHHYAGLPISDGNYVGKIKLKRDKAIFAMYKSGDKVDSPNILKRFYIMGASALALVVIAVFFFLNNFGASKEEVSSKKSLIKNEETIIASNYNNTSHITSLDNSKYISLTCISNTCTNKQNKINLHIDDLQSLLKDTNSKYLRSTKISKFMAEVYLLVSPEFLGLFKSRSENEKGNGFSIIN